ncbi:Oidioi.mRNA.OKI2018_I69.chr2.g8385.t1.cds [Oikopleura dioica]|uniref:Oidioi.mRNA.OKI2018_I69.chr2.g8385.t1.cds n=1 Tax=Oikopleura dioica TaxID=34765 RepID=A0ABN7TGT6_OIKDI|nr:Oidioi.mRNA.OKI2018_I69.chr2.g8385.t1.cds [Oikopleura dioica]
MKVSLPLKSISLSQLGGINFLPNLSSTQLKKSITGTIFKTPSDVPRTAELLESDSGPGRTVTVSSKPRISYQSEYHKISGIVPLKDSTTGGSEGTYSYSGLVLNHTPTNLTNLSNLQSSAGVNICILSPDVSFSKTGSMLFANRDQKIDKLPRRINNTPVELRSDGADQEKEAINQALAQELQIKHYRELFIPGISYPTLPTIFPLLRHAEHWV